MIDYVEAVDVKKKGGGEILQDRFSQNSIMTDQFPHDKPAV